MAEPRQPCWKPKELIHLLVPDRNGPLRSARGALSFGGRFRIACRPLRDRMTGMACSGEPQVTTCPECREHEYYKKNAHKRNVLVGQRVSKKALALTEEARARKAKKK